MVATVLLSLFSNDGAKHDSNCQWVLGFGSSGMNW